MSMTFEDLEAWKVARKLVAEIYWMTRENPLAKDFGLCGQIQRASVSMMSNIAEGFERTHIAEKLQAYNIARASCGEVRSLLYVIQDSYPASASLARTARENIGGVGSLISGLISSTRKRLLTKVAATTALITVCAWLGFYFGH